MHRRFIATLVATALTITAIGSAPARADNDALKALAAIAGIAIVGKVIHDNSKRKTEHHRVAPQPTRQGHRVITPAPHVQSRQVNRRLLPGNCLRSVDTRNGRTRYFGARCLEQSFRFSNRLPQQCAIRVPGQGRDRHGYEARCLNRAGYQLARR